MNERFYRLSAEKQLKIINAGYKVFSQNSYKKSPMTEIAEAADISKSLLFHYFRNKKELYLFLWEEGARVTIEYLTRFQCYEPSDLFEMMERGMRAKFKVMEMYPYMTAFVVKAFYEKDPEISAHIRESYDQLFHMKAAQALSKLNPEDFVPGLDLQMMYKEMYWASEGYLWEMLQKGELNAAQMEQDFERLLAFWRRIYLREHKDACE